MDGAPHLVQYQGSKRLLAKEILKYFPERNSRIIEPFSGTCAISILAAVQKKSDCFWINDINEPLLKLMEICVNNPQELVDNYSILWKGQFEGNEDNVSYFYKVRDEFNSGSKDPAKMLFLLARVVKGAVRYNTYGQMNQSCDKRRNGTDPKRIKKNAFAISNLLKEKCIFTSLDYKQVLSRATSKDLIYMDPPYQGTSGKDNIRDNRYIQGVDYDEFVYELEKLNQKNIKYIVSYDGMTGNKRIGRDLPEKLGLEHIYIDAGTSAQSVLNGKKETTYESLYVSPELVSNYNRYQQIEMKFA